MMLGGRVGANFETTKATDPDRSRESGNWAKAKGAGLQVKWGRLGSTIGGG